MIGSRVETTNQRRVTVTYESSSRGTMGDGGEVSKIATPSQFEGVKFRNACRKVFGTLL